MKKLVNRIMALETTYQKAQPLEDEKYLEDCTTDEEMAELFLRKTTMSPDGKKPPMPIILTRAEAIRRQTLTTAKKSKKEQKNC